MKKWLAVFLFFCFAAQLSRAQDITARKYFTYFDSVFQVGDVRVLENVFYYFDSTALRPESSAGLDTLKKFLEIHSFICVQINVYVDAIGNKNYNLRLAQGRTRNVFWYLVSRGVDSLRLSYKGYVDTTEYSNDKNRRMNRRTEIKIISVHYSKKYYVDGIPMRGAISLPDSAIEQLEIITGGLPVVYGDVGGGVIEHNSPSFTCQYKISFLNQTVEYGKKMVHDTIHVYSIYGDPIADTVVSEPGEGLLANSFKPVSINSVPAKPQQVVVTSCDGTKIFEVEKIDVKRLIEENVVITINGNSIDINLFLKEAEKWNATLSRVSISSIYLKGIEQPIHIDDSWRGLIIYLK